MYNNWDILTKNQHSLEHRKFREKYKSLLILAIALSNKAFFLKTSWLILLFVPDFTWKDINMICQLTSKFPIIFMTTGKKDF